MEPRGLPIIVKSRLIADLRNLGLESAQVVMLHASVKAIGWIVGGPDVVLDAILEVLTPAGTLMMYVAWESDVYQMAVEPWSQEKRQAYLSEHPAFDAATSRSYRPWSILTEYIRTRPGAHRSENPEWSVVAVGSQAEWLTKDHPLQHGSGPGSPFEKLVRAQGKLLLLGSPVSDVSILHYAEYLAQVPDKRSVRYQVPMMRHGQREWVLVEELDSGGGIVQWPGGHYFQLIMEAYLATGRGRRGRVGAAQSYLFEAADLVHFAARWMEREFGKLSGNQDA